MQLNNQLSPFALQFELGKLQHLTDFSCWVNSVEDVKPDSALSTVMWELQRSSQETDNRPRSKLLFSLQMLSLALLFCLYSAHFFTAPHIIFLIFCSHQHLLSFPVFLALNSHFSATIFISVMSWPLSCNSFMLLQNLCQALVNGHFLSNERCRVSPCPFFLLKGCLAAGTSVTYSGSWPNGTSDVRKSCKDRLWTCPEVPAQLSLWLRNKEEKQQRNLALSSEEDSTFVLLDNSGAVQVHVLAKVIVSRGKSSFFII